VSTSASAPWRYGVPNQGGMCKLSTIMLKTTKERPRAAENRSISNVLDKDFEGVERVISRASAPECEKQKRSGRV